MREDKEWSYGTDSEVVDGGAILVLESSKDRLNDGSRAFRLHLVNSLRRSVDVITVCCGFGHRTWDIVEPEDDYPGSLRPLPPGRYQVGVLEKGDFGSAIGRYWVSLAPTFMTYGRGDFGIHEDANRAFGIRGSGTAGCVGTLHKADSDRVIAWMGQKNRPVALYTAYGNEIRRQR